MKKIFVLLMAAALILSLMSCKRSSPEPSETEEMTTQAETETETTTEEEITTETETETASETEKESLPEDAYVGDWWALVKGMAYCLTLSEDGTYTAGFPMLYGDPETGTWTLEQGLIRLNDSETNQLGIYEDRLKSYYLDVFFTREEVHDYVPGELLSETDPGSFYGYWVCAYVDVDGIPVPAADLGENTDVYIEDTKVALGGDFFGDAIADFEFKDNMLVQSFGKETPLTVKLQLQDDTLMRLTITPDGGDETILYLVFSGPEELLSNAQEDQ